MNIELAQAFTVGLVSLFVLAAVGMTIYLFLANKKDNETPEALPFVPPTVFEDADSPSGTSLPTPTSAPEPEERSRAPLPALSYAPATAPARAYASDEGVVRVSRRDLRNGSTAPTRLAPETINLENRD